MNSPGPVFFDKPLIAPVLLLVLPVVAVIVSLFFVIRLRKRHKAGLSCVGVGGEASLFLTVLMAAILALIQSVAADISSALNHPSEAMVVITMTNILSRLHMFAWTTTVLLVGLIVLGILHKFQKRP